MGPRTRVLACVLVAACAGGGTGNTASFGVYEEGSSAASDDGKETAAPESSADDPGEDDEPSVPPDLGSCSDDIDCIPPDDSCYGAGACNGGVCQLAPRIVGDPCDDADPCTGPDVCDGAGACIGEPQPCVAENASGGVCMDGLCMGLVCDPGFGNCNGDWSDGCELGLDSITDCGACGEPCEAGENATATCTGTTCERECVAPWANCDGDWSNGCEIPEGVANMCDVNGLNAGGCWTPWCGASADADAINFGTWFCFDCNNCHVPAADQCQWCDHATGNWFAAAADCYCGSYEDVACSP